MTVNPFKSGMIMMLMMMVKTTTTTMVVIVMIRITMKCDRSKARTTHTTAYTIKTDAIKPLTGKAKH